LGSVYSLPFGLAAKKMSLDLHDGQKKSPDPLPPVEPRGGLSKEAWVTIGTLGAALITGLVTLTVHLYPKTAPSNSSPVASPLQAAPSPPTVSSMAGATPVVITADSIAGKWLGQATDSTGRSFLISLQIRNSCAVNEQCGSISVNHVPCYGEVFLDKVDDGDFEFRVANFYGESNRKLCQPGGGEHFRLRPDGKLVYTTTYEPKAEGLLERQGL
jgi:hypothetical protein